MLNTVAAGEDGESRNHASTVGWNSHLEIARLARRTAPPQSARAVLRGIVCVETSEIDQGPTQGN